MTEWKGRSLAFARTIKGLTTRYTSALEALDHTAVRSMATEPDVGAFVWWNNLPYGDVAIWVGEARVLGPHPVTGKPDIIGVGVYNTEPPVGWSLTIGGPS